MERTMKKSGSDWIKEVPQNWGLSKIGQMYSERREKVSDRDYPPLSVTMQGVVPQLSNVAKSDAHDDRKLVCKGDFVINSRSDRRGSCGISPMDGSVSLINTVLQPRDEINPDYYNWLFHTTMFSDEYYKWGHGIVDDLWTTNWTDMKKILVPEPPIEEQRIIAEFLTDNCSKIDEAVQKTKASIDEYKKLKQIIITNAVIRDNGWKKSRIKYCADIFGRIGFRGYTTSDMVDEGEGAITLSPSNLQNMKLVCDKCAYISWDKYNESPEIMIKEGDILFVKTGSSYGKIGYVEELPMEATINPQLVVFKNISINNKFFLYSLQSTYMQYQVEQAVIGGTIPTMSQEKIKNFILYVPDADEQEKIVKTLDEECGKLDYIISQKEKMVQELEEYKKAFIYEYVTGKKGVL